MKASEKKVAILFVSVFTYYTQNVFASHNFEKKRSIYNFFLRKTIYRSKVLYMYCILARFTKIGKISIYDYFQSSACCFGGC